MRLLGEGGFGSVWLAADPLLRRRVAVKVPRGAAWWDEQLMEEARELAKVSHPALVAVLDAGWEGGTPYVVLEHVDGCSLEDALEHGGPPWDPAAALEVLRPAAAALDAAHAAGVLHRDLKPANLLVPGGRADVRSTIRSVKVTDLGLAGLGAARGLRGGTAGVGDPRYAAPESWRGSAVPSSDVFALAATWFRLVTGFAPNDGSPERVIARASTGERTRLRELRPDLSKVLDDAVAAALSGRRSDRPADAKALVASLEAALAHDEERTRVVEEARRRIERSRPAPSSSPRSCAACGGALHALASRCPRCGEGV